jgi:hypothetical protein
MGAKPASAGPHTICPATVYTLESATRALGLRRTTPKSEVRQGRLRVSRRGGRYYFLGKWLLEWLEAGEVRRQDRAA